MTPEQAAAMIQKRDAVKVALERQTEGKRLPTFREICETELREEDRLAKIVFEGCYLLNPDVSMSWHSAQYQAPETPAGWAARNAQWIANEIRLHFVVLA